MMTTKFAYASGGNDQCYFDEKEREALIVRYAPLVKRIAGRMAMRIPSSVLFDELLSAGCLGLINAVDRFDPERDVNLKTYAEYRIKGAILDELRRMDWYSRSMRKKNAADRKGPGGGWRAGTQRPAEAQEIAAELGIALEDYFNTLSDIHRVSLLSLDEFIKDEANDAVSKKSFQESIRSADDPSETWPRRNSSA